MVYSPSRPQSFTPTPSSAKEYARPCRLCSKQKEIRTGPDSGYPVSRNSFTSGLRGSFLPESKAWEIVARPRHLSSLHVLTYAQVSQLMGSLNWASGLIPLGCLYLRPFQRHFHSLGLKDRFMQPRRSDPMVLANLLRHWQVPRFSYLGNPSPHVPGGFYDFYGRLQAGVGRSQGFPDFRVPGPVQTASSTSIVWSSRRYLMPYCIGLKCSRATRL